MSSDSLGFIAALDIGTTTLRCQIIDHKGECKGASFDKINLLYPDSKSVEIFPDELWKATIDVVKMAIKNADISVGEVRSLAISSQRATFVTWRKDTGETLHNFITWKDLRAANITEQINSSWKMAALHTGSSVAHFLSRQIKFGIVANLKFTCSHVTPRLLWLFQNNQDVRDALSSQNLQFGTIDTWLVYKLTSGKTYVTDISNASATGLYDPFSLCWGIIPKYFNIPLSILPPVVDNDFDFGETCSDIFGVPVKIGTVVSDQSAAMFGTLSHNEGDVKLTLGTGAFLNVNTGKGIKEAGKGVYPLVGWRIKGNGVYLNEVACSDAGSSVQWLFKIGLISNVSELSNLIDKTKDNGGVYFVPAFSGLGPPINDECAASGFIGIGASTRKEHLIRAVLESIVYRTVLAYNLFDNKKLQNIIVDGGVSGSDFICQLLADLTGVKVRRANEEMSTLGAAYLAGLNCGFWANSEEVRAIAKDGNVFKPTMSEKVLKSAVEKLEKWRKAAERFMHWYDSK
ncbi:putative glycerol kinase 5 [Euwallacea fornicatus]|uniref:putative glycerol kinase 5 n=1 Tax=Euwallacea fornicatus TaxID=995702 RepID=UPI00339059EB